MARIREYFRDFTLVGLAEGIYRHWRGALAGVVLAIVALGAWMGYDLYRAQRNREASAALMNAFAEIRKVEGTKERDEAAIKQLRTVSEQHAGTPAAGEALVRLGHDLYEAGKYDEARQAFASYLQDYGRGPLRMMAAIGKAYAEEAKGDLAAAEKTLSAAASDSKNDPLAGEAELALGRVYEELKKTDEALKVYGQIAEKFPQTHWAQSALERMASLRGK